MSGYNQIIRYLLAGGIATSSNLLILFICVNYFHLWYLIGAIFGFCCGVIVSYFLQKFFTFKNYSKKDIHKQFISFFIFALLMLSFNTLLMYVFVDIISLWYMLAQFISSVAIAFINYMYFNKVIFKTI